MESSSPAAYMLLGCIATHVRVQDCQAERSQDSQVLLAASEAS